MPMLNCNYLWWLCLLQLSLTEKTWSFSTSQRRLFLIWLFFFPPRKWVFIYSHQWAIGAFQQRWWQDIKQIVCSEVIIKHNPVVSYTDLSLWQKQQIHTGKLSHQHTPFPSFTPSQNTSPHTPLWFAPPQFPLHHHKRWRTFCLFPSRPPWMCLCEKVWSPAAQKFDG